jgi:hypothetical protein
MVNGDGGRGKSESNHFDPIERNENETNYSNLIL